MAREIERKFLVTDNNWKKGIEGVRFSQGYLNSDKYRTVRVRLEGNVGKLTVKGLTEGIHRLEFEYVIPEADAKELLTLCEKPLIEKIRYRLTYAGHDWEIDEFLGENVGLVVAEVELQDESTDPSLPTWAGREVSDDPRYFNSSLIKNPYCRWEKK